MIHKSIFLKKLLFIAFALLVIVGQASAQSVSLRHVPGAGGSEGIVSGQGTQIVVEVSQTGITQSVNGIQIAFDFDQSLLSLAAPPGWLLSGGNTVSLLSLTAIPVPASASFTFTTKVDVTGREFSIGISSITLDAVTLTPSATVSFNSVQSRFSLSLDVDGSAGDQSVTSANVSTDEMVAIEIFGQDIRNANGLSVRFEYDAGQVTYDGFAAGDVLPNAQALPAQGTGFVEIGIASLGGQATANSGLVGTVRFRTTGGFSGTVIRLVRAELGRGGQIGSMTLDVRVELKLQVLTPDFNRDGRVNFADFLAFAGQYGARQGDGRYEAKYDLDSDGAIGFGDFLIFSSSYGKEVSTPPPGGGGGGGSPDLIVESPSVNDNTLTAGQSFTLSATVRNQGDGQSPATTLRYYRSSNATISATDTEVGTDAVDGLADSGTSAESISLTAPSSAGTYYYGACVASVSGESNTNNNCSPAVQVTVSSGSATPVDIPDANLRAVIADSLGKARGASITRAEIATLTRLAAPNSNIRDLTGLEYATGLTWLDLGLENMSGQGVNSNNISDLSPLSGLTNLTVLELSFNSISDMSALSNLTNLRALGLSFNSISDASALSGLINLQWLSLFDNDLTGSIPSELGNLTSLTVLNLGSNDLTGSIPSELGNLTNLRELSLSGNQLSGSIPSELGNLANLERLFLHNNAGLSGPLPGSFTGLSNLGYLRIDGTGLCAPTDAAFRTWLQGIANKQGVVNCGSGPVSGGGGTDTTAPTVTNVSITSRPASGDTYRAGEYIQIRVTFSENVNVTGTPALSLFVGSNTRRADYVSGSGSSALIFRYTVHSSDRDDNGISIQSNGLSLFQGSTIKDAAGNNARLGHSPQADVSGHKVDVSGGGSPDLIVESLSVDDNTLTTGQSFTLNATVRNQGNGQSATTTLRYYRSSDATISTTDTEVGTDAVDGLAASGTSDESISLNAPSSAGTYYYGACVESVSGESDTNNNCSTAVTVTVNAASSPDRDALVALYNATDGPNWKNKNNWLSDRLIGEWYGVTTDANGRVTVLDLRDNGLTGSIPAELGSLSNLQGLWLENNGLTGSIPAELGSLSNLQRLWLKNNGLTGSIPAELGNLSNLQGLYLSGNRLTGSIPSELGSLSNLVELNLYNNGLTGSIPAELGNLTNLKQLHLDSNGLTGRIPAELGNLTNLTRLYLSDNQLSGSIPAELGSLSNLQYLSLGVNQLSGSIPSELGSLSNLRELLLDTNQLSGSIPSELGSLSNLQILWLARNQLSGSIPSELGSLSNLQGLFLLDNQLSGSIPAELGSLSNLIRLLLFDNAGLSGPLPGSFTGLGALDYLYMDGTGLCTPTDAAFQRWLQGIAFKRGVANCGGDGGSTLVTIPDANLRAVIADSLGKASGAPITRAEMATLTQLDARRANISDLTGLEYATSLEVLDLGINSLSDVSALAGLTSLRGLGLGANSLSDVSALAGLTSLEVLDLSGNSLSNVSALAGLTSLRGLGLGANSLSDVSALAGLTSLEVLDLSGNSLSNVSVLSNLTNLIGLSLSRNSLSDVSALSNLTNLRSLFLSNTGLSDVSALSGLTNLTTLWLPGNRISDIAPLVTNTGLGRGDEVDVRNNPLSGASRNTHIPALQSRGVAVYFGASKPATEEEERGMISGYWEARILGHSPTGGSRALAP